MPYNMHIDTMFPKTGGNPRIAAYNFGTQATTHTISAGNVVCYYSTDSGVIAMPIIMATAGTAEIPGGSTWSKEAGRKVIGIALETIATLSTGIIALGGVTNVKVAAAVNKGDWLKLGGARGQAISVAASSRTGGLAFGKALETIGGAGTIKCWLWTYRV